jgi:hypothetical protein
MLKQKQLLYFLVIIFLNLSCARFQNSLTREFKKKITVENLSEFSQAYHIKPSKILVGKSGEAFKNQNEIFLQHLVCDSTFNLKPDYVKAEFLNNTIYFMFYENKLLVKKIGIEAKLKRNGFIKLKNTKTNCQGIPYIFGGCDQKQMRIGFTKNEQMTVQEAVSNTGAFLFVFGTGYSYNAVYIFDAIE